ncbi:MAG TPA: DNA polymerase ligase N-terminal domain-containing protein [Candidatus Acidoferrales bacterium]
MATPRFVVQKHRGRNLHYDFRLEVEGTLKSWAVPKGPSLNPANKRLAMQVEDHPLKYGDFEGVIPEGQYGAGPVMVWDQGTFEFVREPKPNAPADPPSALKAGALKVILHGKKLRGQFALILMRGRGTKNWLLIKDRDAFADRGSEITETKPDSALSGRSLERIFEEDRDKAPPACSLS